jgi:hypothetical protein
VGGVVVFGLKNASRVRFDIVLRVEWVNWVCGFAGDAW